MGAVVHLGAPPAWPERTLSEPERALARTSGSCGGWVPARARARGGDSFLAGRGPSPKRVEALDSSRERATDPKRHPLHIPTDSFPRARQIAGEYPESEAAVGGSDSGQAR